ncbi:MAG: S1 RNA-binding domain-containing protein [Bacteroidota bacterium]|nr:S1 RNA-binding domain-containing protein [Bacteroidota bacterium]MDP4230397.1 S1 RNA-binding domain-containing protein [Bacteroidota bacterium]MDP4237223.1 S1 RNA-binding domain-containing protein [Bacteroidota bacterium]
MSHENEEIEKNETNAISDIPAAETPAPEPVTEKPAGPLDELEKLRRSRQIVSAKVIKWANNGLAVELESGEKASMPNNHIDLDPDRNIAKYFGKTIPVRIINLKMEHGQPFISVSHRSVLEDDLKKASKETLETMNVGDVIEAKVKAFNIKDVIVDLGPGVDAVIHGKDLSWEHFNHPYEVVKRGQVLSAKVLQVDKKHRTIQLGVRQLTPDPYIENFNKFHEGDKITAKVMSINDFGAEVSIGDNITAFLPISEISWERIPTVDSAISNDEEFEVQVLVVDPKKRRITVSKKRLIENPIRQREEKFKIGSDHNGTIKEITKGGIVVAFEDGTEGFVPRRELSHDRIERLEDVFKKDKPIEALRVIDYDRRDGKITLSFIAAEKEAQRKTLKNYRATPRGSSFSLGELGSLKEKLEQAERNL